VTLTTPIGETVTPRLALDIFYLQTKFGDSRFSRSGDMIAGMEAKNGYVTLTTPLLGMDCRLDTVYLSAKFDDSSFSHSRDMLVPNKLKWFT